VSILDYTLPVAIISFNRPQYLRQCIESLENQSDLKDVEFILFQDGWKNNISGKVLAKESKIRACESIFAKAKLPNKSVYIHNHNVGVAINHQFAYETCFNDRGYEVMVLSEDDLIYSKDWLRCTKIMLRQFRYHPNIATVQASVYASCGLISDNEVNVHQDTVRTGKPNWLGFGIWREKWEIINSMYMQYYNMIKQYDYLNRDHLAIRRWYIENWQIRELMTSQDRAREWSCVKNGMARAYTVVMIRR